VLGEFPSPVERLLDDSLVGELWVKRDDLNARAFGGNKVRALEWLLGDARAGDTVLTIGGEGSTHVLSTAEHAAALGVESRAIRWRHEMHDVSHKVAARSRERASVIDHALAPVAMLRAIVARRSASPPSSYRSAAGAPPPAWRSDFASRRWTHCWSQRASDHSSPRTDGACSRSRRVRRD
jgi:hypothetical protein